MTYPGIPEARDEAWRSLLVDVEEWRLTKEAAP